MLVRLALGAYTLTLAWIVFAPAREAGHVTGFVSLLAFWLDGWSDLSYTQAYPPLEFLANIVLFIPYGALWMLSAARVHPSAVIGLGLVTSALIEIVQLALPSRFSSLADVIANTLGAALGVSLVLLARKVGAQTTHTDTEPQT